MNFDFNTLMQLMPMFSGGKAQAQSTGSSGDLSPLLSMLSMFSNFGGMNMNTQQNNSNSRGNEKQTAKKQEQKVYATSFAEQNGLGDTTFEEEVNNRDGPAEQNNSANDSFMNMMPMLLNMMSNPKAKTQSSTNANSKASENAFRKFYDKDARSCKKEYITSKYGFQKVRFAGKKVIETLDSIKSSVLSAKIQNEQQTN